jgi:ABC-type Fe3+-hydroxamate transport system substrate-binding protein
MGVLELFMLKFCTIIILALVVLSSCSVNRNSFSSSGNVTASTPPSTIIFSPSDTPVSTIPLFQEDRVLITDIGTIIADGHTTFSDGTVLLTQLYQLSENAPDQTLLSWWPSNQEFIVQNQLWEIKVSPGENGGPAKLSAQYDYYIKLWVKDFPSLSDVIIIRMANRAATPT